MITSVRVGNTPTRLIPESVAPQPFRITNNLGVNDDNPEVRIAQFDATGLSFANGRPLLAGETFAVDKANASDYWRGIMAIGTVAVVAGSAAVPAKYSSIFFFAAGAVAALSDVRGILIDLSQGANPTDTQILFADVDQAMTAVLGVGALGGVPVPSITFTGRLATATLAEYESAVNSNADLNVRYRFDCVALGGVSYSNVVPTQVDVNAIETLSIPTGGARHIEDYAFGYIWGYPTADIATLDGLDLGGGTALVPAGEDTGGTLVAVEVRP